MTLEEFTPEKILEDVARLQYLYRLKKVIRYAQNRQETDSTESVAEHVYGMMILAQYFLPLENPEGTWDRASIYEMISLHDIDEIETGDVIGWAKTDSQRALELSAMKRVVARGPVHMQEYMNWRVTEYEARETSEARFVRAIDKLEPQIHLAISENRILLTLNQTTAARNLSIKLPYMKDFPFIQKCCLALHQTLVDGGYYWQEGE